MVQRKTRLSRLIVAFIALAIGVAVQHSQARSAEDGPGLRAGIAKIDITPKKPVRMAGYGSRKDLSTGVHDPLYARVVVLQSEKKRLVLVSVDFIGFYKTYEPIRDAICAQFDLQPSQLFLSGTHTHSGPTPSLTNDPHPNNLEFTASFEAKLLTAVGQAIENMGPVQMGIGRGYSPVGANRRAKQPDGSIRLGRNPYGPTDKEVLVMKLARPDGSPIAAAFDYATHGTSLGPKNLLISSDVPGIAAQFVEKFLGSNVTAPVFAGASGNIDPWYRVLPSFETRNGWVPEPVLLGTMLGEEVVHVYHDIKTNPTDDQIKTDFATLELPAKQAENQNEDKSPSTKPLNVTVAKLGDICFVGLGCELLTEIGLKIKAGSPCKYTFVITHCNGGAGYLPPEHLYKEGGYEIRSTGFAPQAADMMVEQTLKMLSNL